MRNDDGKSHHETDIDVEIHSAEIEERQQAELEFVSAAYSEEEAWVSTSTSTSTVNATSTSNSTSPLNIVHRRLSLPFHSGCSNGQMTCTSSSPSSSSIEFELLLTMPKQYPLGTTKGSKLDIQTRIFQNQSQTQTQIKTHNKTPPSLRKILLDHALPSLSKVCTEVASDEFIQEAVLAVLSRADEWVDCEWGEILRQYYYDNGYDNNNNNNNHYGDEINNNVEHDGDGDGDGGLFDDGYGNGNNNGNAIDFNYNNNDNDNDKRSRTKKKKKKKEGKQILKQSKTPTGIIAEENVFPSQNSINLPGHGYPENGKTHNNTFRVQPKHVVMTGENPGVNFNVETVPEALPRHKTKTALTRKQYLDAVSESESVRGEKVRLEAVSSFKDGDDTRNIVSVGGNGFLIACVTAFAQHLPLGLHPDHIWTLITYAFAKHVDKHSEELRHHFVQHEGKKLLKVLTPDTFQMSQMNDPDSGATVNEWETFVFPEFSKQIKEHIGEDTHSLLVEDFTTSTAASRASNEIVLMSAMKNYFSYKMITRCGIPNITMLGTEEDWVSLRNRTEALGKLMKEDFTSYWMPLVLPILDEFVASYRGNVNHGFWQSMVKLRNNGMCSGRKSFISGWIQIFFPYLANGSLNIVLHPWEKMYFHGPEPEDFPNIFSSAPVLWDYWGTEFKMNFNAGITAVSQNKANGMLFPEIGWHVSHAPPEAAEQKEQKNVVLV